MMSIIFITAVLSAGGKDGEKDSPKLMSDLIRFEGLINIKLQKVCEKQIVLNFEAWFDAWMIQSVVQQKFVPPTELNRELQGDVKTHLDEVNNYIQKFTEKKSKMLHYSNVYFDIQMNNLLTKINALLEKPYVNIYQNAEKMKELEKSLGPYASDFPSSLEKQTLTLNVIENFGTMFFAEYNLKTGDNQELKTMLVALTKNLIEDLKEILNVFTNTPNDTLYKKLDVPTKDLLQKFYDTFYPLLDVEDVKKDVLQLLTGQNKQLTKSNPFFTNQMYNKMLINPSKFDPLFLRDKFIVLYKPEYKLEDLHKAATKEFFSWDFLDTCIDIDYDKLIEDKSKELPAKMNRKIARLHTLLYGVYSFARKDGTLDLNSSTDKVAILQKLFQWVIETKEFDFPHTEEDAVVQPGKELHSIIKPEKFRRYFLPLLQLICSKIPGCKMMENPKKKEIVDKFVKYGNLDELKSKKQVASLVPIDLLNEIAQESSVVELKEFARQVEDVINVLPDIEDVLDAELEEPEPVDPKKPADKKKPVLLKKTNFNKLQDDFNKNIGDKFLPTVDGVTDPKKTAQLEKLFETIEATETPAKKNVLRKLLLKFIFESSEKEPIKSKPLIDVAVKHVVERLRGSFNYDKLQGLKNFFMKTLNNEIGSKYTPTTVNDEFLYTSDIIFFVNFAAIDKANTLKKNTQLSQTEKNAEIDKIKNTLTVLTSHFFTVKENPQLSKFRKDLAATKYANQPLLLEKAVGIEFMYEFRDFFNYYEQITNSAQAVGVHYYRIYLQFYQFITHLRRSMVMSIENPHQFVLEKLESCMKFTEKTQAWVYSENESSYCVFSHRKYAEMYFFYKSYLLDSNKPVTLVLDDNFEKSFNTHSRLFLVFAQHNPEFNRVLSIHCKQGNEISICASWKLFLKVAEYLRDPSYVLPTLEREMSLINAKDNVYTRINILNGLEAVYLATEMSNMIDWEKLNFLFNSLNKNKKTVVSNILTFKDLEVKEFGNYLSKTYKKYTISKNELNLATIIQNILNAENANDNSNHALDQYLVYANDFIPIYIKLFLQYAVTDKQFEEIARLLIKNGISIELIKINDLKNDSFFFSFVTLTQNLKKEELSNLGTTLLRDELRKKYEEVFGLCEAITVQGFKRQLSSEIPEYDPLAELDELKDEVTEEIKTENKEFEATVHTELVEKFEYVTISEDKTIDEVIQMKKHAYSNLNPNIKVELQIYEVKNQMENEESELNFLTKFDITSSVKKIENIKVEEKNVDYVLQKAKSFVEDLAEKFVENNDDDDDEEYEDVEGSPKKNQIPNSIEVALNIQSPSVLKAFLEKKHGTQLHKALNAKNFKGHKVQGPHVGKNKRATKREKFPQNFDKQSKKQMERMNKVMTRKLIL